MELMEAMATRRSVRAYKDTDIPEDLVDTVIRAAMMAPSAGNQQPWQFIVVRDREKMKQVTTFHPYAGMLKNVSVSVIVCGDPDGKKWPDFWVQDCSAAIENMLLAARDLGLGTVWAGIYPLEDRMAGMRKLFHIPENVYPLAIIPIGWPDTTFKEVDRYDPSRIHLEVW